MMKLRPIALGAMIGAAALTLSLVSFGNVSSVSAAGPPRNAHNYPRVLGVNGSEGAIVDMNIDMGDRLLMVSEMAPATAAQADVTVTEYRLAKNNRLWVQISGKYCKNKTGGDVFLADGAPMEAGLTC
jgi:hypothetical protein